MIKIVGDINFSDGFFDTGLGIGTSIKNKKNPFSKLKKREGDLWIGNLECVVSKSSNKSGIYKKQFLVDPDNLGFANFIDYYNVANNHIMQHGEEAYKNTTDFLKKKKINYFGCQNQKTKCFNYKGKKISITGFSQRDEKFSKSPSYWYNPEYSEISEEFSKIIEHDFKIAYIHWGNEFINKPYNDQKKFARWLIDLGFDLIIGLHPHVLQGYEEYKGKRIYYSLGNFIFNMPLLSTRYSCVINLDFKGSEVQISNDYIHIERDNFPRVIDEKDMPNNLTFNLLNELIDNEVENEVYYNEVNNYVRKNRRANYKFIVRNFFNYKIKDIVDIFLDYIKRKIKK